MDLLRSAPAPLVTPLINALSSNAWISDLTSWALGITADAQLHLLGHNLQRAQGRAHPGARVPEEGAGAYKNYGCAETQLRADYSYNSQPNFGFLWSAIKAVIINY